MRSDGNGRWVGLGRAGRDAENRDDESRSTKVQAVLIMVLAGMVSGTQETRRKTQRDPEYPGRSAIGLCKAMLRM